MNKQQSAALLERLRAHSRIILSRHVRPDGDAVGSTFGLREILRDSFPDKQIYVSNDDETDRFAFLGTEDGVLDDEVYRGALLVVLDTANVARVSNGKYALAAEVVRIDHHPDVEPFGNFSVVEPERSSTAEILTDFWLMNRDVLTLSPKAATMLYTGIVTDSGRFRYREATGETLRAAAALLDVGVETERIYANLYLDAPSFFRFKAYVYQKMKITAAGVAYIVIDRKTTERFGITNEEASAAVAFLDSICGSLIWAAFIENPNGTEYRVRLRSRFLPIDDIATLWRGGGHPNACGATVYDVKEMRALLREADRKLKNYKENNVGWR